MTFNESLLSVFPLSHRHWPTSRLTSEGSSLADSSSASSLESSGRDNEDGEVDVEAEVEEEAAVVKLRYQGPISILRLVYWRRWGGENAYRRL